MLVGATVGIAVGGAAGGGGMMFAIFSAVSLTTSDTAHTLKKLLVILSGAFRVRTEIITFCSPRMPSSWAAKS